MTEEEYKAARLGRNALARKWRKEHPDRVKANNARYYQKKKAERLAEQAKINKNVEGKGE